MIRILAVHGKKYHTHIRHSLEEWGYEVKSAQTPLECREILNTNEFDMVLLRLEPDEDWPVSFQVIRKVQPQGPIIGLTTLSKRQLNRLLATQGMARADFVSILHPPLKLEDIVFVIEGILVQVQEETVREEEEKPVTKEERRQQLAARRSSLENQRLASFLATYTEQSNFS